MKKRLILILFITAVLVFAAAYEEAKEKLARCDIITVRNLWEIGAEMYCSIEDGHTLINFYDSKQISESEMLASGKRA